MTSEPPREPAPPDSPQIEDPDPKVHGFGQPHFDRRVLAIARAMAEKTDRNPGLLEIAVDNPERWAHLDGHGQSPAPAERRDLTERRGWPERRAILVRDTDEGHRPRGPGPVVGIVSRDERTAILTHHPHRR